MKISEIYKNINKDYGYDEIYVDDFTSEQVYFQIEPLCNGIIDEHQNFINQMHKIFQSLVRKNENIPEKDEKLANVSKIQSEDVLDSTEENQEYQSEKIDEEKLQSSESLIIEECTDHESFSDCSSEDEDTYSSNDLEISDIDETKSQPANEIFRLLDKNIRKSKNK